MHALLQTCAHTDPETFPAGCTLQKGIAGSAPNGVPLNKGITHTKTGTHSHREGEI